MGFGVVLTGGDDRVLLADELLQWLVEVRVELELSKPTRFALRFEDDLCGDDFKLDKEGALAPNQKIGVFVRHAGQLSCLVFGPITETRSSAVLGGSGSWFEAHGEDRRVEMGRVGVQATYAGRESDAAAQILRAYRFEPSIQRTLIHYQDTKNKLTQRGTDLAFLEEIARKNNMEFWIDYQVIELPGSSSVGLVETGNLRTSPTRAQPGDEPQIPKLVAPAGLKIRVAPPTDECPSVNRFEAKVDFEKPAGAVSFAMSDAADIGVVEQSVKAAPPPNGPDAVVKIPGVERKVLAPPEPTGDEGFLSKEAIAYEQSWFVEVECSSTIEQLDFVVLPHQIVAVSHGGGRLSGAYQVMTATHVITSTDHFVDFTLRANGLGGLN